MKTNIFISFSFSSSNNYKEELESLLEESNYAINYSEKIDRSKQSDHTIWKYLKTKIYNSSIMLLIYSKDLEKGYGGKACKFKDGREYLFTKGFLEGSAFSHQGWIYKELRCALANGFNNRINGILVIVTDNLWNSKNINNIPILKHNYKNRKTMTWDDFEDSFIPLVKMSDFINNKYNLIQKIRDKRNNYEMYRIIKETD